MSARHSAFSVDGCVLTINREREDIEFSWPIGDVIEFDGLFVVRLEPDPGSCFNENVYGVSAHGEVIWKIERRKHVYNDSPYTSILKVGQNAKLFNWDGDEFVVDPKTGVVIVEGFGK